MIECGPELVENAPGDRARPYSAFVVAADIESANVEFPALVESHGASPIKGKSRDIGGEFAIVCGGLTTNVCIADWHRDGLMISVGIWRAGGGITEEATIEVLASLVAAAVETLAGDES